MIKKLLNYIFSKGAATNPAPYTQKQQAKPVAAPPAVYPAATPTLAPGVAPVGANSVTPQPNLVNAIKDLELISWEPGKLIFHGCTDQSPHVNIATKQLTGDFKWASEDPLYACDYAYRDPGNPYFFVCRLVSSNATCLLGSQKKLIGLTNWTNRAPWLFPKEFGVHSMLALNLAQPAVFFDHKRDSGNYGEILVSQPAQMLEVVDMIALPKVKDEAKKLIAERYTEN